MRNYYTAYIKLLQLLVECLDHIFYKYINNIYLLAFGPVISLPGLRNSWSLNFDISYIN